MGKDPLISVIIPVYNVEKWLDRCLSSVRNQSYRNLEIILVDDGSTDGSGPMCDKAAEKDSRILVIHKENGGLSDARNAGLSCASGEYISFIDSDDWVEINFLRNLYDNLNSHRADICGCDYRICLEGKDYPETEGDYGFAIYTRTLAMSALIRNEINQVVWNKLYKREVIDQIFFEKGKYHEDEFWAYQVFGRIRRYVSIGYVGYNYFQRADSIMGLGYSLKRLDAVEARVRRQSYLEENLKALSSLGRINLFFTCFYHGQQALTYLKDGEERIAFHYLKKITKENKIHRDDLKDESLSHRIWIRLGSIYFKGTCRIRNFLKIGI